jgi:hypothetical protein
MKKTYSSLYIQNPPNVTQKAETFGYDPEEIEKIIQLVDLMCLGLEDNNLPVS